MKDNLAYLKDFRTVLVLMLCFWCLMLCCRRDADRYEAVQMVKEVTR